MRMSDTELEDLDKAKLNARIRELEDKWRDFSSNIPPLLPYQMPKPLRQIRYLRRKLTRRRRMRGK